MMSLCLTPGHRSVSLAYIRVHSGVHCESELMYNGVCSPRIGGSSVIEPTCPCRKHKRLGFSSWVGKIAREGNGNLFPCSCLGNPMDREACRGSMGSQRVGHDWAPTQSVQNSYTVLKVLCVHPVLPIKPYPPLIFLQTPQFWFFPGHRLFGIIRHVWVRLASSTENMHLSFLCLFMTW